MVTNVMAELVSVWGKLMSFFADTLFDSVTAFFYDAEQGTLTFPGIFAVIMAGIALILLVFNLIRSFMPMHG